MLRMYVRTQRVYENRKQDFSLLRKKIIATGNPLTEIYLSNRSHISSVRVPLHRFCDKIKKSKKKYFFFGFPFLSQM